MVIHDAEIPGVGSVHTLPAAELPRWVPTMEEALQACGDLLVDLEVKAPPAGAALGVGALAAAVVGRLPVRADGRPWLVTSFWPEALSAAAEVASSSRAAVAIGALVHPSLPAGHAVAPVAAAGWSVLLPAGEQVDERLVDAAHRAGLAVAPWTVNDPQALEAMVAWGVDAVITDVVDTALARRGHSTRATRG